MNLLRYSLPFLVFILTFGSAYSTEVFKIDFRNIDASKNDLPAWINEVAEEGGSFDQENGWSVKQSQPFGVGKILISLNRESAPDHLALIIVSSSLGNMAVQLVDERERLVAVDLMATRENKVEGSSILTVAVPLVEYPTARAVILRRLEGDTSVTQCSIIPLKTSIPQSTDILRDLAAQLGDPLSPSNPLKTQGALTIQSDNDPARAINFDAAKKNSRLVSPLKELSEDSAFETLDETDLLSLFRMLGLQGYEFNAKDFVKAAGEDRVEVVELYLRAGMPIDSIGATRYTAAAEAANSGALRTLRFLCENGANLEIKTAGGNTPLWLACLNANFEAVRLLVEHGAEVNTTGAYGYSAVSRSWKSRADDKDSAYSIVLFLLEEGADPDVPDNRGQTLLHIAATAYTPFYEKIVPFSSDLEAVDKFGLTPLKRAAYWNDRANIRVLEAAGAERWIPSFEDNEKELAFRINRREWKEALELLNAGTSPDAVGIEGIPVIFHLIDWRDTYGVGKLVEYGVSFDVRDNWGQSPLGRVAGGYHPKRESMIDLLLENGMDPNYASSEDLKRKKPFWTPLMKAAASGNAIRCRVLLEAGADPTIRNLPNRTASIVAERAGHLQLASELRNAEIEWKE